jgi:uncharacterized Zn finger protein
VDFGWQPYVPVAERRRQAEKKVAQLKKKGQPIAPVKIEGRTIASSFWGKSWCSNLERYSDFESRLPRVRTYVRNGSVVDLQIANGEVTALVAGSELYKIKITIAPVKRDAWKSICRDCAGSVSSLVELLQGRIAKGVMDRVCREGDGLFPAPKEIKLSCSCPDWASMCKHVAAALYGVGARLDSKPELLFVLRGVDQNELLSVGPEIAVSAAAPAAGKVLADGDVAALFGLEMADAEAPVPAAVSNPARQPRRSRAAKTSAAAVSPGRNGATPQGKVQAPAADAAKASGSIRANGKAGMGAPARTAKKSGETGTPVKSAAAKPRGRMSRGPTVRARRQVIRAPTVTRRA